MYRTVSSSVRESALSVSVSTLKLQRLREQDMHLLGGCPPKRRICNQLLRLTGVRGIFCGINWST